MSVENFKDLNDMHKDVLLELGNIGTGNALTSLSQLTCHPIQMDLPHIRITDIDSLGDNIDFPGNQNAGVVIDVHGDLDCVITFLLNEKFAKVIAEELSGETVDSLADMGTDIEDLGKLPLKSQDELNTINEMYKTITEQNTQLLALYDSGEIDQGLALANGDIENNAVKMRTAINTIIDRAQTRAENKHSSTISLVKQQKTLALIMSILVLLLTMVLCLALTRSIKRPLDEMERAAKQLAEGDLSQDITYESKDELGVLASGLRNTIAAMMGLTDISNCTHKMEDFFSLLRDDPERAKGFESSIFDLMYLFSDYVRKENRRVAAEDFVPGSADNVIAAIQADIDIVKGNIAAADGVKTEDVAAESAETPMAEQPPAKDIEMAAERGKSVWRVMKMSFKEFDMAEINEAKEKYAKETEDRWGTTDAYKESQQRTARYNKDDWQKITAEYEENLKAFAGMNRYRRSFYTISADLL